MSDRSTTFGYEATISVHGVVLKHVVESLFFHGTFPDSFGFVDERGRRNSVRIASMTGELEQALGDAGLRLLFYIKLAERRIDGAPWTVTVDGSTIDGSAILSQISIEVSVGFVRGRDDLMPDLAGLAADDVRFVPDIDGLLDEFQIDEREVQELRAHIADELRELDPETLRVRLILPEGSLGVDSTDLVSLVDEGTDGALCLGLYSSTSVTPAGRLFTRGEVAALLPILVGEETFAFRMSSAAFDRIIEANMLARFGDAELVVPRRATAVTTSDDGDFQVSGPSFGPIADLHHFPSQVTVSSEGGAHKNVRLVVRTSRHVFRVTADNEGAFRLVIPAAAGDTIVIQGETIEERSEHGSARVRRPKIRLAEGHIRVSGEAYIKDSFDVDYDTKIVLEVDPLTPTGLVPRAVDSTADLPWYLDLLGFFLGFIWTFIKENIDEAVGSRVVGTLRGSLPDPVEGLGGGNMVPFIDRVSVTSDHFEVGGTLHAGSIAGHDRRALGPVPGGQGVRLPGEPPVWIAFAENGARTLRSREAEATLVDSHNDFARLGEVGLSAASFSTLRSLPPAVTDPALSLVRGPNGRLTKMLPDRSGPVPAVRFVTYEAPPVPDVNLLVSVSRSDDIDGPVEYTIRQPSSRWSAFLRVEIDGRRLFINEEMTIEWELPEIGVSRRVNSVLPNDSQRWRLNASDLGLVPPDNMFPLPPFDFDLDDPLPDRAENSRRFSAPFRVTVTDVFGRTATASASVSGFIGYPREFDDRFFGRVPRPPLPPPRPPVPPR